jgi:hypothetical protein
MTVSARHKQDLHENVGIDARTHLESTRTRALCVEQADQAAVRSARIKKLCNRTMDQTTRDEVECIRFCFNYAMRSICRPNDSAKVTGTAFPICRAMSLLLPKNWYRSGKVCKAAASRNEIARF